MSDSKESDPWPRTISYYLHSNGEENETYADDDEPDGNPLIGVDLDNWFGAFYEVEFQVEVYQDGTYKVLGIEETQGEAVEKKFL